MNVVVKNLTLIAGMLALASCTSTSDQSAQTGTAPNLTQVSNSDTLTTIKIDGSSTVYPITAAIGKEYAANQKNKVQVQVNFSGTSGGFKKFCAGEIDISNASRPITTEEMEACRKNNVAYIEIPVAFDALSVVVHPQNTWAKDITVDELKKLWEPGAQGKITKWSQIRASWPDRPIKLFGAGKDSGTFDYFTEATVGKAKASRTDYTASEDDDVIANGVSKDPDALGYFGYAYYQEHKDKLRLVAVNNGKGAVLPETKTVENNTYQPLSRPLFIYINPEYTKNKGQAYQFVNYYLQKAPSVVSSLGYVPLPDEAYRIGYVQLNTGKIGTVYAGKPQLDLTIAEVLRKQKQF
ncbi:protein sphX [Dulcicalothrix desertica PCC 7102]|uniref:Phosphate-binding protein n=1 Tax=Dulcicalothrix desertica PCC 7102 TaxID=232991 RepID=A0A433VDX0_9CYAN|nr:PstS family phosphate ABC transporter substrate-binding protein [Dulcicalothrix desertica]RUT04306.1 protein sphX [Dulcicalothrix desertica PCC 7102]TWH51167.1 phosphate ABC transporter substrate-binding protein (PhoT family) [Dulcicalothrix desertica PCC 7102]